MNDILTKINILSKTDDKRLYHFISEQLTYTSTDVDFWISLAIVIVKPPFGDEEKAITFLNKALAIDNHNSTALLILAYVYEHELGGIDDMLLHQIKTLHTNSDEINSMLKYVASWSYRRHKKDDPLIEEKLLKESIQLCNKHVWNHVQLAALYMQEKRYLEVNSLLKKALNNVKKIYSYDDNYNTTDINEFINERIKGIYLTKSNIKFIKQDILPTHIILFYLVTTPFLRFYHFIKTKILQSMNLE